MGLEAELSPAADYHERQAERVPVSVDVRMGELGARGAEVRIHNLSTHGFMADTDEIYAARAYVWLELPNVGKVNAKIMWRDCFRYGCEFVTPLNPAQCAAAVVRGEWSGR